MSRYRIKKIIINSYLNPIYLAKKYLCRGIKKIDDYPNGILLDVGCGLKPYKNLFTNVNRYIGIELPTTLSQSKVVDIFADTLNLPFKNCSFDTILCTEVLEHIREPKNLFSEAARVLRANGILILSAPQVWGIHEEPHDYYRYTKYGLRYLAGYFGFEVIDISPTCGFWGVVGQRISSNIYNFYGKNKPFIFKALVLIPCCIIQIIFDFLNYLQGDVGDTLDNILVAYKK